VHPARSHGSARRIYDFIIPGQALLVTSRNPVAEDPCALGRLSGFTGTRPPGPAEVPAGSRRNHCEISALMGECEGEEMGMKKALAILATLVTVGATTMSAPAEARHIGPGLAFGLAAGALTAGAIAAGAYGPYYYGPRYYGYYGPAYYGPGPYAYYGGPYYVRHRHWRHYW
jgi:hypothetical protein